MQQQTAIRTRETATTREQRATAKHTSKHIATWLVDSTISPDTIGGSESGRPVSERARVDRQRYQVRPFASRKAICPFHRPPRHF